ncbi:hypothetical protein [Methylosinus sporium]|uniref:hypothetical protein n=1 Tax=Methylosinus sporium TaxID=428 RepID=UPI00383AF416
MIAANPTIVGFAAANEGRASLDSLDGNSVEKPPVWRAKEEVTATQLAAEMKKIRNQQNADGRDDGGRRLLLELA